MAQFYGTLQGARGSASRLGTKNSGVRVTAETWDYVIDAQVGESNGVEYGYVALKTKQGQTVRVLFDGPLVNVPAEVTR